jgi:crotonobetainyl-CoA:carnitine CoA-transferase CaiB-like acyl-CoA transferase
VDNRELLRREILQKQLEKTADEWMAMYLQDSNIAAEPYRTSIQAMDHPAVLANGAVVTIHDPRVGPLRTLAPLVDFKDTPGEPSGPAPDVGQHTDAVLERLRQRAAAVSGGVSAAHGATVPTHPLSGVTILDLATIQAGPYGASLLADLGARVIKIDATDRRLDEGRRSTAQALADARTYAGKECLQVDLQTPEGKAIVHKLIAKADVLSHNYRPGVRSVSRSIGRPAGRSILAWSMFGWAPMANMGYTRAGRAPIPFPAPSWAAPCGRWAGACRRLQNR